MKSSFSNNFDNSGAGPSRRNPVSSRVLVRPPDTYPSSSAIYPNKKRKLSNFDARAQQLAHRSGLRGEYYLLARFHWVLNFYS